MYATDNGRQPAPLDSRYPGVLLDSTPITGLAGRRLDRGHGLPPGHRRPGRRRRATASSTRSTRAPRVATPISAGFAPASAGRPSGSTSTRSPDALRITSNARQNYRISFATGNHASGEPRRRPQPRRAQLVGSAYTNSALTATDPATTTLFDVDSASNQLFVQNPPNAGTLTDGKPLGVDITETDRASTSPAPATSATWRRRRPARAARPSTALTSPRRSHQDRPDRHRQPGELQGHAGRDDHGPGRAPGEPRCPKANIAPGVQIVKTTQAPKPGQRAAYIAQAMDPDGAISKVEWDTDGDGPSTTPPTGSLRIAFPAGTGPSQVRVTDERGARTATTRDTRWSSQNEGQRATRAPGDPPGPALHSARGGSARDHRGRAHQPRRQAAPLAARPAHHAVRHPRAGRGPRLHHLAPERRAAGRPSPSRCSSSSVLGATRLRAGAAARRPLDHRDRPGHRGRDPAGRRRSRWSRPWRRRRS